MSALVHEWRFHVGRPHDGNRLDAFLAPRLSWCSREDIKRAIAGDAVEILLGKCTKAGEVGRLRPSLRLRHGQEIVVRLPAPQAGAAVEDRIWQPSDLDVVLEDEDLVVVNKPPALNIHASPRHRVGSLLELLHERHHSQGLATDCLPTACHRLDRDTTGLVVFAKGRRARAAVQVEFESRKVQKAYLAIVSGVLEPAAGCIDLPLGPDDESEIEFRVAAWLGEEPPPAGYREARTRWRRRAEFEDASLIELHPETGRQHQLRVHLAAVGHPILGDKLYLGGDALFLRALNEELSAEDQQLLRFRRHALHAWRLSLTHPSSGERLQLEGKLPPDFTDFLGAEAKAVH